MSTGEIVTLSHDGGWSLLGDIKFWLIVIAILLTLNVIILMAILSALIEIVK